ncbi:hypothetical protein N0V91_002394 [Didymella pomorum]|uniref:Uncharacterized protein n=1 Tax=Didymella pomorum TaxID=749634 RepID=A0A9W9DAA7_9PLEO|nr:hypothetical protein N0V91_002394 [Didymella pomorum]
MLKGYPDAVHCRFKHGLDLSYELRQESWDFAMRAESYTYTVYVRIFVRKNTIDTDPSNPSFLPKACRVSKFMQQEPVEVFLHGTVFQVCAIEQNQSIHSFLNLAPKGFEYVRRLQFAFFDCFLVGFALKADLELAIRCPGLQELQITFHDNKLIYVDGKYIVAPDLQRR